MVNPPRRTSTVGRRIPLRGAGIRRRNARGRLPVARRLFASDTSTSSELEENQAPSNLSTPHSPSASDTPHTPLAAPSEEGSTTEVEFTEQSSDHLSGYSASTYGPEESCSRAPASSPISPPQSPDSISDYSSSNYSPIRTTDYAPPPIEGISLYSGPSTPNYSPAQDYSTPDYSPVRTPDYSPPPIDETDQAPANPPPLEEDLSEEEISELLVYLESDEFLDSLADMDLLADRNNGIL